MIKRTARGVRFAGSDWYDWDEEAVWLRSRIRRPGDRDDMESQRSAWKAYMLRELAYDLGNGVD